MTDDARQIANEILAYLAENPDAKDTLKGISEWWLSGNTGQPNITAVEEALTRLVAGGLVLAREREGAQTYYEVNRQRLKEIKLQFNGSNALDPPND
jgi:hypothetical protein